MRTYNERLLFRIDSYNIGAGRVERIVLGFDF